MAVEEKRAKLFQTGRSQAVRLPKEFRFEGTEVRIRRAGQTVVLEPISDDWKWLDELRKLGPLDDDVVAAANEKLPQQERPELDNLFAK
jgi:antitoxin VapB